MYLKNGLLFMFVKKDLFNMLFKVVEDWNFFERIINCYN